MKDRILGLMSVLTSLPYFRAASASCASRTFFFQARAAALFGLLARTWFTRARASAYRPDSQSVRTGPLRVCLAENSALPTSSGPDSPGLDTSGCSGAAAGEFAGVAGAAGRATTADAGGLFWEARRRWRETTEPMIPAARIKPTTEAIALFVSM